MNGFVMYLPKEHTTYMGIVLRYTPATCRIVLVDRLLGKQAGVCFSVVAAGSCIIYERTGATQNPCIHVREIIHVPLVLARSHLILLHTILEVCDVGLPLSNIDAAVFSLLLWVCSVLESDINEYQQDVIVAKLFILLGLHSPSSMVCDTCIMSIHTASVDTLCSLSLDSKCAAKLKDWLYYSLSEQLPEQCLRTGIFFKKE